MAIKLAGAATTAAVRSTVRDDGAHLKKYSPTVSAVIKMLNGTASRIVRFRSFWTVFVIRESRGGPSSSLLYNPLGFVCFSTHNCRYSQSTLAQNFYGQISAKLQIYTA